MDKWSVAVTWVWGVVLGLLLVGVMALVYFRYMEFVVLEVP